jgi:hypothetical protein
MLFIRQTPPTKLRLSWISGGGWGNNTGVFVSMHIASAVLFYIALTMLAEIPNM